MWARFVEGAVKTAQDISNDLKTTVSGDRYRFVDEDINLDLTYITNRIVAMGFPAQGDQFSLWNVVLTVNRQRIVVPELSS